MSTLVLMKAFETVPSRYDVGMRLITFGEINRLRRQIAEAIPANANVLDVGCGTGELITLLTQHAAQVTAIDKDPEMVRTARERVAGENTEVKVTRNTALEIDRLFKENEFDAVVLSLVMSELTTDERAWVVDQCTRILKPNGLLIVADEFKPAGAIKRFAFFALRWPLHLIAYLFTQIKSLTTSNIWWKIYYTIVELPLMLLSFLTGEPLTRPVNVSDLLRQEKLTLVQSERLSGGAIRLLKFQKDNSEC